jgi:hypothetical protein
MTGFSSVGQTLGATDTSAHKPDSHKLTAVAVTEMVLPWHLWYVQWGWRRIKGQ